MIDSHALATHIAQHWQRDIIPRLCDYIAIPALSPLFDPDWAAHGHIDAAVALALDWVRRQPLPDCSAEVVRLAGRTPTLVVEVAGSRPGNVLIYGHLDKQPALGPWRAGLAPFTPVIENGRLYGRGGADDGYAVFAAVSALSALAAQNVPLPRCVLLIETSEESGSPDLPAYVEHLRERIGVPDLVIGLDSGCGDYERLWVTTSLRGMAGGTLSVAVLTEGVHSGDASGIVPDSFRIARLLLSRIEDEATGVLRLADCFVPIDEDTEREAARTAQILGPLTYTKFPWVAGARPISDDLAELVLNRTLRPTLTVTGADGLPPLSAAGNVLRPETRLKLSFRLPPGVGAKAAMARVKTVLEAEPPYGAQVVFELDQASDGWRAPAPAPWLAKALSESSHRHFGRTCAFQGEGWSIPFMGMLGRAFPQAQFLITGVLGPGSNAHGPNEFLHLDYARRLTACVAEVVAAVR